MTDITIGADVEGFVRSKRSVISAIGLIGGDKDNPLWVDKGNLQEDNVLAEFAINPAASEDEFVGNIQSVIGVLSTKLAQDNFTYLIKASHVLSAKQLLHPHALKFGCDPDFDAWAGFPNTPPNPIAVGNLRTAGGHIHIGYDDSSSLAMAMNIVKWMDLHLGVPSVLLDTDKRRRKVYGKAGAFRKKDYGLEYRTLSNFWIGSEELMRWAYKQTLTALKQGTTTDANEQLDEQLIVDCINNGNKEEATQLIEQFNVAMP